MQTEEEKKAERLAKLEAWKQKQAAERDRKQKELENLGGTRGLLDEIDKKAQASPTLAPPAGETPESPEAPAEDQPPIPYAGKFDPKAIARKAAGGPSGVIKLGTDVALPAIVKASAHVKPSSNGFKADKTAATESFPQRESTTISGEEAANQ